MPQGGEPQADFEFAQESLLEFDQRQIGLLLDPAAQGGIMLFQTGASIATALLGLQAAGPRLQLAVTLHAALGDLEEARGLRRAVPTGASRDHSFTQIDTVGLHRQTLAQNATD